MGTRPTLNASDCGIPPPPNLVLAVALPRPQTGAPDFAVIELLPLAISPDAGDLLRPRRFGGAAKFRLPIRWRR